jgi:sulfur carrier protein
MRIVVNGQSRECDAAISLAQLLDGLALEPRRVAVELNRRIVPRSRYAATRLADRDELEIVTLVGGG